MFILDLRSEGCENCLKWLNFDEIIVISAKNTEFFEVAEF